MSSGKNHVVAPEEVMFNTLYELSLGPNDSLQCFDSKSRLVNFTLCNHKIIHKLFKYYNLNIEVSPHGRLHFHGYTEFKNIDEVKEFYIDRIHDIESRYTIALNKPKPEEYDGQSWEEYINKQSKLKLGNISHKKSPLTDNDDLIDAVHLKFKKRQLSKLLDNSDSDN